MALLQCRLAVVALARWLLVAFGDFLASPGLLSPVVAPVSWGPGVEAGGPCRLCRFGDFGDFVTAVV